MRLGLGLGLVRLGKAIASFVRDGLKLYYPFRDNNPELLLSGATSFDTTDDYIDLGDSADWDFGTGDWSFAHWIKITEDVAGYSIWRGTGGTRKWGMLFDHVEDQFFYAADTGAGGQHVASGNNTAPINNWYHVAYTRSSGTGSIYINGALMNTVSNDTQNHSYSDSIVLGNGQNLFTSKLMSNVGIWNRALSASEIESIYWRGQYADLKGTELTNLVSWYNLKDTGFGSDVVTNGDLWTGASGSTKPTGWSGSGGGTPTHTIVDLSSVANFDSTTLRFTATGVRNIYQQNALSGVRYKVEFAYRTDSSSNYIYIGSSGNQIALSNTGLSGDATLVSQEIDSNGIGIGIQIITSDSTIEISSMKIYPVSAPDAQGDNEGTIVGATTLTDAYSASSPFLPRIQDKATPKGAVALASGSTSFDGSDDYIDIGDQQILTTAGTLSCWVKLDSNDSRNIINKFDSGAGKREYMLYTNASGHISFTVQDSAGSYDSNTDALSSTTLNTGIWYFISATFSTSEVAKLYVDGSLVASASASISDAIDNTNEPIYLGQGVNSGTPRNFFDGSIANVAIYSDAKTQSQIQDIMFSSYSTLTSELKTNLVSWYDLGSTELGSEKSPNVTFDSNITGWSGANWAWESDGEGGGRARHTAGSTAHLQSGNILTVGLQYEVSFTVGGRTAGSVFTRAGASGSGTSRTANGDYTEILTCLTNGIMYVSVSSDFDGYVDNVSFKPIEAPDSQGDNEGSIYGATTNTGYTNSPSGVADPLNYGEVYGGNAVSFDGTNDYIDLDGFKFSGNQASFSFWVKFDSLSGNHPKQLIDLDTNRTIVYYVVNTGLSIYSNNATVTFGTLDINTWYHIVGIFDGTTARMYVDGSQLGTDQTIVALDISSATQCKIGANFVPSGSYFDGMMSGVKVFNTALTQDQVRELYTKPELTLPTGVSSSALKLDMPMQEGSGTAILDGSPTFLDVAVNGDFSADAVGSTSVTGWSLDDFTAEVIADGFSGNAVQLTRVDSGTQSFYQDLSGITSGNEYKINVKLKAIGGSVSAGIRVTTPTNSNPSSNIVSLPADGSWQDLELSFTAQGTTARIQIQRQESNPGSIVVDDVIINQLNLGQNHGTGNGITWATGQEYGFQHPLVRSNNPMVFDGSNDYVDCGTGLGNDLGDNYSGSLSMSMWFKADTTSSNDGLFHIGSLSSESGEFEVQMYNNTLRFRLSNTVWWRQYDFTDTSSWHHLVCIYDTNSESNSKMYIDGVSVGSTNGTFPSDADMDFNGLKTIIGSFFSTSLTFDGMINDVAIWDSALTANEVTALYNSGLPLLPTADSGNYASAADLVGYWRNDGVTTWTDRSTNSNNGTVSGSPASIIVPEGLNEGRDSQGYYLTDTDSISSGIRFKGAEYIDVQDSESLDFGTSDFTLECWLKTTDQGFVRILDKRNSSSGYTLNLNTSEVVHLELNDGSGNTGFASSTAVNDGNWHHIAVSVNRSSNALFYIDGSLDATQNISAKNGSLDSTSNLIIGADAPNGDSLFLNGSIDEIKIYKGKVLSASEVLKNYNNGKSAHSN